MSAILINRVFIIICVSPIGTDAEMDEFLSEVENYLKESGRL